MSKNSRLLFQFKEFCQEHPELRFWQAIYAFFGYKKIRVDGKDPFYFEEDITINNKNFCPTCGADLPHNEKIS